MVHHLCSTLGFTYTPELGANIGEHNKSVWDDYVKVRCDEKENEVG